MSSAQSLGTEKIGKLLVLYAVPAIIATAAASLYNIIDRIFIGQGVSPMAISGLGLTLPLMNITAAFGAMVGIGASAMVSINLGKNDRKGATLILGNAFMLNILLGISISVLTLIFLDPILYVLGASPLTLPYAREFMQIILLGNVFTHLYLGLNNIMRASGYPRKAMFLTLTTVGINIILAPVFIFVLKWGIRGAALATVLAQTTGAIIAIRHFTLQKSLVQFLPGYFKLKKKVIGDIISIGMSNFFVLLIGSIVISLMNIYLKKYGGDYAIGAYGIISSIANLVMMVIIGFNQGMQPIVGYNYGARQMDRVLRTFKLTLMAGTAVSCFGFLMAELIPVQITSVFTSNNELINLSVTGMRLNLMLYPIIGFQLVTTSFFQSVGKARISIFLSLTRQVIFLIPAILILPPYWGIQGIWISGPVSDFCASVLTLLVLRYQLRKLTEFQL